MVFLFYIAALFLFAFSFYISREFDSPSAEQILFHFLMPLNGTGSEIVNSFLLNCMLVPFIIAIILFLFSYDYKNIFESNYFQYSILRIFSYLRKPFVKYRYLFVIFLLISSFVTANSFFGITGFVKYVYNKTEFSDFYEKNYIFLNNNTNIFPEKKQNLIVIYVESLESSFVSVDEGGLFESDLMPEINTLAKLNINFSHNDKIGGFKQLYGTSWTIAGLIASTCGIPLKLPFEKNLYDNKYRYFLPGANCLTDILAANDYNISFLLGSSKDFAGIDIFLKNHGQIPVKDFNYYKSVGKIDINYNRGKWGIEDNRLYALAKEELSDLSMNKQPFAFFMMTIDTHMSDEFLDKRICEKKNEREYKYIDVMRCASMQLDNFVNWIKKQKFYKDTTVVILGDHLSMNKKIFPEGKGRKILNIFINARKKPRFMKSRYFSHFDIYPSILVSMGANLDNKGIALGRSLFDKNQTLLEKYSARIMNAELIKRSKIYDCFIFNCLQL
ncbi:MAG: LTA synthase family protein [Spirochaetia bacterium]|nr:LTA synthase family protein [Spirochaetia bacterium]